MKQLDLIDDDPRRVAEKLARANRIQAETELSPLNRGYTRKEREQRAAHYTRIAEQYEQQLRE